MYNSCIQIAVSILENHRLHNTCTFSETMPEPTAHTQMVTGPFVTEGCPKIPDPPLLAEHGTHAESAVYDGKTAPCLHARGNPSIFHGTAIHIIYDVQYTNSVEQQDLIVPITELAGRPVTPWILTNENVDELVNQIPKDGIVILHADAPPSTPAGGQFHALRTLLKSGQFPRVMGHMPDFCEQTMHKSIMKNHFVNAHIPHAESMTVTCAEAIDSHETQAFVASILGDGNHSQLFLKMDGGFNSAGLKNGNVISKRVDVSVVGRAMINQYGPIVIQRYLGGREFTCAVCTTPKGTLTFHPIERMFAPGQLFSPPDGTVSERVVDSNEEFQLVQECRRLTGMAYDTVSGCAWGRVDLRCDREGNVFVLEVNNTASFAHNSYFDMSVKAAGYTRTEVLEWVARSAPWGQHRSG